MNTALKILLHLDGPCAPLRENQFQTGGNMFSRRLLPSPGSLTKLDLRLGLCALLSVCLSACVAPAQKPSAGHLLNEALPAPVARTQIPQPVQLSPVPPRPKAGPRVETYSVVVQNVEARELLFALARDAKVNVDIHPGIMGTVTLNALDQTLPQLLERIGKQVDMRWEMDGPNLSVMPDSPFLRTYKVDYVNMERNASGTVSVTTQVSSSVPGSTGGQVSGGSSNNSVTKIENTSKNHFWESLTQNIKDILRETDKILPEGSSEEVEEVSGNVATTGTGAQPTAARGSGKGRTGTTTAAAALATSPNAAELQNQGLRVVRRTTFREAASVIANPESGIISVRATSRQHGKIQEFLGQVLGSARRQVMIEATVAEVRLDRNYQQGIDWSLLPFGNTGFRIGQVSATGSNLNAAGTTKFIGQYFNTTSRVGNIGASIKLLETFGNVKVLSSPKISVLNNQTAVLKVVDNEVYFTIKADTTATAQVGTTTTYTTTVNSVPVGFVMNVTPQISEGDTVVLNVRPSISRKIGSVLDPNPSLALANIQSPVPVIRTREMESVMRIENGNVAVMGGLMEDSLSNTDDTIPGLNRIPVLGSLFANRNDESVRTELVVFLRPTVIKSASLDGDYRNWRDQVPSRDFFSHNPGLPSPVTAP
ncbi:MAG: secretin N-terminal domain-containing protein [Rhodocyclaceae bacterium]|nr:secretin N-terminal domain-containing protein [Rhodocyclaceae bacterium]